MICAECPFLIACIEINEEGVEDDKGRTNDKVYH